MEVFRRLLLPAVIALFVACATAPRPTAASRVIASNSPATIEGRVRDAEGRPVEGIGVLAIPRGKDIPWSSPSTTDAQGRFRLTVFAPAQYGFLLSWEGRRVITTLSTDPARVEMAVRPGEHRKDVELLFLREEWEKITARREKEPS